MQDYPAMVARYDLDLRGYFDAERMALLDKDHCIRLNYEAYFFADTPGADRFRSSPLTYCGLLTDPVSKQRFRPRPGAAGERYEGVDYYFESDETRRRFAEMPASYWLPGYKMKPKATDPDSEAATDSAPEAETEPGELGPAGE